LKQCTRKWRDVIPHTTRRKSTIYNPNISLCKPPATPTATQLSPLLSTTTQTTNMEVDSGTVNLVSSMVYVSVLVPVSSEGVRRLVVVAAVALDCSGGRIGHDDRLDCLPLLLLQWTGLTEAVRCDAASLCFTTGMRSCSSLSLSMASECLNSRCISYLEWERGGEVQSLHASNGC
jgi:hypothetical protein